MQSSLKRDIISSDNNSISNLDENQQTTSFNISEIIKKYGENSEILQLILTSKLEEDRRRVEEAKLEQKKIEYCYSEKGNTILWWFLITVFMKGFLLEQLSPIISLHCHSSLENDMTSTILSKGKEKQKDKKIHTLLSNPRHYSKKMKQTVRPYILNTVNTPAKCNDNNKADSNAACFTIESSTIHNKAYKNLNQISNLATSNSALQLKSLDYLKARRNSHNTLSSPAYYSDSFNESLTSNSSRISPNTLPPIGQIYLLNKQAQDITGGLQVGYMPSEQPKKTTSESLITYQTTRSPNLLKLNPFEASIMENLGLENETDHGTG